MADEKDERELAFIRDLEINESWTRRFTDLIDKNFDLKGTEKLLYVNAGTGDHCIAMMERSKGATNIHAICENHELLRIARDKAAAVRSPIELAVGDVDEDEFDLVILDASFTAPAEIEDEIAFVAEKTRDGGQVAVLLPSAGSFGEIFSLLWEVLFSEDLGEHGAAAEEMISEIPTVSQLETIAEGQGLEDVKTETVKEVFEYTNGAEFIASPLIADLLLPRWTQALSAEEKRIVWDRLANLIDSEDQDLTFRFTVKATLLTGTKAD